MPIMKSFDQGVILELHQKKQLNSWNLAVPDKKHLCWKRKTTTTTTDLLCQPERSLEIAISFGISRTPNIPSLKLTFSPLKMDGWNTIVYFWGWPIFRCYVSFREGTIQVLIHPFQKSLDLADSLQVKEPRECQTARTDHSKSAWLIQRSNWFDR